MSAAESTHGDRPRFGGSRQIDGREAAMAVAGVAFGAIALFAGMGLVVVSGGVMLCVAVLAFLVLVGLSPTEPVVHDDNAGDGGVRNLSHEEFERLVEGVERASASGSDFATELDRRRDDGAWFERLVRDALDELPEFVQASLGDNVAVVVSDDGAERSAYGYYHGGTVATGIYAHTILIYRDTLVRDFGYDQDELRRQVTITVRHEIAHHIGASERRVAELGL